MVWGGGAGKDWPDHLPTPVRYFTQISCLFPKASRAAIDWRAEGWRCDTQRWEELDTRAHFPMRPDDKENRYHRLGYFYRQERVVMHALDDWLIERENEARPQAERLGGIRVVSIRAPLPPLGAPVRRYQRRPLASVGEEERKEWYFTSINRRHERCGAP